MPTPCTSSRTRAEKRTNVQLWCASPHECVTLQQLTGRFVLISIGRYLSGLSPPAVVSPCRNLALSRGTLVRPEPFMSEQIRATSTNPHALSITA